MRTEIKITGLAELEKKLSEMDNDLAAKNLVGASYTANRVVEQRAKENILSAGWYDTGLLYKSVKRKKKIYRNGMVLTILTGIDRNAKGVDKDGKPRVPWRYANVLQGKTGFMSEALESQKETLLEKFKAELLRRIKKFTK